MPTIIFHKTAPCSVAASLSLSHMLKMGKLIKSDKQIVSRHLKELCSDSVCGIFLKAESFFYLTEKPDHKLMVTDIQGVGYSSCEPEIASANLCDEDNESILFCSGNLSLTAINNFLVSHVRDYRTGV